MTSQADLRGSETSGDLSSLEDSINGGPKIVPNIVYHEKSQESVGISTMMENAGLPLAKSNMKNNIQKTDDSNEEKSDTAILLGAICELPSYNFYFRFPDDVVKGRIVEISAKSDKGDIKPYSIAYGGESQLALECYKIICREIKELCSTNDETHKELINRIKEDPLITEELKSWMVYHSTFDGLDPGSEKRVNGYLNIILNEWVETDPHRRRVLFDFPNIGGERHYSVIFEDENIEAKGPFKLESKLAQLAWICYDRYKEGASDIKYRFLGVDPAHEQKLEESLKVYINGLVNAENPAEYYSRIINKK